MEVGTFIEWVDLLKQSLTALKDCDDLKDRGRVKSCRSELHGVESTLQYLEKRTAAAKTFCTPSSG